MKRKIPDILSEEELKNLLKMEIYFSGRCYGCPLNDLAEKNRMSCARVMQCICGKTPSTCNEAIIVLRDFLNEFKSKQNKI